jgi:cytochrome c oxidase assembly protein subunit 15
VAVFPRVPAVALDASAAPVVTAQHHVWRHRFSCFTALAVWVLLIFGANVTSHDAGLAVPDWPTSLGFLNPIVVYLLGLVRGLVAYEHNHRVAGAVVGILAIVQAVWLWRTAAARHERVLGVAFLVAVSVQGLFGGLTVRMKLPPAVSVTHGVLAQSIFCLAVAIAYTLSREWRAAPAARVAATASPLRRAALVAFVAAWCQLLLGAIVRHTSAKARLAQFGDLPVVVHMVFAAVVVVAIGSLARRVAVEPSGDARLTRPVLALGVLLLLQLPLGFLAVIRSADPAVTVLHVMNGATLLAVAFFVVLRSFRLSRGAS